MGFATTTSLLPRYHRFLTIVLRSLSRNKCNNVKYLTVIWVITRIVGYYLYMPALKVSLKLPSCQHLRPKIGFVSLATTEKFTSKININFCLKPWGNVEDVKPKLERFGKYSKTICSSCKVELLYLEVCYCTNLWCRFNWMVNNETTWFLLYSALYTRFQPQEMNRTGSLQGVPYTINLG